MGKAVAKVAEIVKKTFQNMWKKTNEPFLVH